MALLSGSWLFDIFTILIAVIAITISWLKWTQTYWQRRGIPCIPPSLPFGNSKGLFSQKESVGDFSLQVYNYFRSRGHPYGGIYLANMAMFTPCDPDLIKVIMQNDFDHFVDRGVYFNEETDPLSAHLFSLEGTKWRNLRVKLTPTFTSGKMKMMFETLTKCGDQLIEEMEKIVGKRSVDIKDILVRFTTDIIGNCAFGIDCNSLKNPDNEFTKHLKLFFVDTLWENIVGMLTFVIPDVMRKFGVKITKPALHNFFMDAIQSTVDYREKNNVYRKDFMHLLLQLKNRGKLVDDGKVLSGNEDEKEGDSLTMNELAAQAFVFFLAGFETSSTTMTFCLFELASNQDIQEKLRQEVLHVLKKHDDKLTYDAIMEMHYMDKVINETLRKYPPLPSLNRICTKDYRIPGTDLVIEEGTKLFIPILGLQRDPEYYPDPEKFDPERFSEENKGSRHPYTFLPFGEGPRICIGMRFGLMQTKVGLSYLMKNYKFSINSKTVLPLELDPSSFIMSTKGGIWLDFVRV